MFDSIFSSVVTPAQFFAMSGAALVSGLAYSWIMSFRIQSKKRFFIVTAMIPFVVAAVISFVNGNIGTGVAIGGAFSLIRFRSAQGSAEEITAILVAMGAGIAFGLGYIAYGVIILLGLALLFLLLSDLPLFEHRGATEVQLLKITIPESLAYNGTFDGIFAKYLNKIESAGVKTTDMGSMFRLSYKVLLKDPSQEKEFIDELRTKNGNLEISLLPYTETLVQL